MVSMESVKIVATSFSANVAEMGARALWLQSTNCLVLRDLTFDCLPGLVGGGKASQSSTGHSAGPHNV